LIKFIFKIIKNVLAWSCTIEKGIDPNILAISQKLFVNVNVTNSNTTIKNIKFVANINQATNFAIMNQADQLASHQKAYITTGNTAGTVGFQFAKNSIGITSAANEIMTGSWVRVEKVK
jgi:hypothetical protein